MAFCRKSNPAQARRASSQTIGIWALVVVGAFLVVSFSSPSLAYAQVPDAEIAKLAGEASANRQLPPAKTPPVKQGIDLLTLTLSGGIFMIPIGLVSLVVVTFVIDRFIGLRTSNLFPPRFRKSLGNFARQLEADPRMVFQSCLEHPSAAANVVKDFVVKIGRPVPELQAAAAESIQRQVDRAYSNVRWINFSAGVAPLLGLLGTVWGLIRAFHDTTMVPAGQNRADFLAVGIYEALVTTLAGLIVAIPAAVASHYFEGLIQKRFAKVEESVNELIPRFEVFEGKTRFEVIGRELAPRDIQKKSPIAAPPVSRTKDSSSHS